MAEQSSTNKPGLAVRRDEPLIALFLEENGQEVVRYFASEEEAYAALSEDDTRQALAAIGAFSDLDLDEMIDALDRIRHESSPTSPIDPWD
jgi:hypothetical protein